MFDQLYVPTRLPNFLDFTFTIFDQHDAKLPINTRVLASFVCEGRVSAVHLQSIETLRHHLTCRGDLELDADELVDAADELWDAFVTWAEQEHEIYLPLAHMVAGAHCVRTRRHPG